MSLLRINRHPGRQQLAVFSLAWLVFFGTAAAGLWFRHRAPAAMVAAGLAVVVPLGGLVAPRLLRVVYVALSIAVYPIGYVVSHVVLAILYYLVVTPLGVALRLGRHDPLALRAAPRARSYWQARDTPETSGDYFRQS